MSSWTWTACVLASIIYAAISVTWTWRRERALTAQCQADENAKTDALLQQITDGHDQTEETSNV